MKMMFRNTVKRRSLSWSMGIDSSSSWLGSWQGYRFTKCHCWWLDCRFSKKRGSSILWVPNTFYATVAFGEHWP